MKTTVKYDNILNTLDFMDFTATDFDLLMFLCAQMKDRDEETVIFSLTDIKRAVGFDMHVTKQVFTEKLEAMYSKLLKMDGKIKTGSRTRQFVLFITFDSDYQKNTLEVKVHPDFKFLLNDFSNFTKFELQEFISLKSKYSKTLYRLLKQYRTKGEYHVKIEDLKKLLGCPPSYDNKMFTVRILNVALEELKAYFIDLEAIPRRLEHKRGRPIASYDITFKPEEKKQKKDEAKADQRQDEAPAEQKKSRQKDKPRKTSFNNFNEREYNYSDLEKVLLNQ